MKRIISVFTIVLLVVTLSTSVFAEGDSIIGRTFTMSESDGVVEVTILDETNLTLRFIFNSGEMSDVTGTYTLNDDIINIRAMGDNCGDFQIIGDRLREVEYFVPVEEDNSVDAPNADIPAEDMIDPSESKLSAMIDKLTSSTFWVTMATVLSAVVACIALLKNKLGIIVNLIKNKADTAAISSALKNNVSAISNAFKAEIAKIEQKLSETEKTEKQLLTVISIFMSNAKINPNTRSEIMKILTGIKEVSGELTEIIEETNQAIAEANAAEEPAETPALTAIENEIIMG